MNVKINIRVILTAMLSKVTYNRQELFMEDILIEFQIYLNDKELINNHDWDFEKEAKNFIKQRVIKPQKCKCRKATFTRTVDADFNCLCGKCGHPI